MKAPRWIGAAMAIEVNSPLAGYAQELFDQAAGRGQQAIDQVETDLVEFSRLLVHQVRLRKALADPGLPPEPKRALLADLGQGRLEEASVELLATVATHQRVRLRDFPRLLAALAAMAAFTGADRAGQLEQLEGELFFVATLVEQQPAVRSALTNPGLPVANKRALLADLLQGRVGRRAATLADLLVELNEGHDLDTVLKEWAEAAAARRNRVVAEVRSAIELDDQRRTRLAEALTRVLGRPVVLQTSVDPAILGSVVVRVGDELFDGSIRSRLEQAREALGIA
jgi:F-type H+-transporting ATPase subunit delta